MGRQVTEQLRADSDGIPTVRIETEPPYRVQVNDGPIRKMLGWTIQASQQRTEAGRLQRVTLKLPDGTEEDHDPARLVPFDERPQLVPPLTEWWFRGQVRRIIDADSLVVRVDLGFDVNININVRVAGVNAPEDRTPEGRAATLFAVTLLSGSPITLRTEHDRSFARWIGEIWLPDGSNYAERLIAAGHGVPYPA
jgi:endonuclease YncB( thermonuclease family)